MTGLRAVRRGVAVVGVGMCLVAAAHAGSGAAGKPVEGFVTQVDSATGFEVGSLKVTVGAQAGCSVRKVYWQDVFLPPKGMFHPVSGPWRPAKILSETPVACDALALKVGSRVRLRGKTQGVGALVADKVVRIVMTYAVPDAVSLKGMALLESDAEVQRSGKEWSGRLWLDGYPMAVTPETTLLAMPGTTSLAGLVQPDGTTQRKYADVAGDAQANAETAVGLLRANSWVSYKAMRGADGSVTATQLRVWPNVRHAEVSRLMRDAHFDVSYATYLKQFAAKVQEPDYGKQVDGTIKFRGGHAIQIVADKEVQAYVSRVGMAMVPQYQKDLPETDATKIRFRFYVVKPFKAFVGSGFQNIHGALPVLGDDGLAYSSPPAFTTIQEITAVPNGMILIPDSLLVRAHNEAQLAALLAYAVTSVVQEDGYRIWLFYLTGTKLGGGNSLDEFAFILRLNQQVLRLGLRPLLEAGYDLREAPFAWRLANGTERNPETFKTHRVSETESPPWYARYSMGVLSEEYGEVDYGKLRRGEGEYAEFLKELNAGEGGAGKE